MTLNLFDRLAPVELGQEELGPGARVLRQFAVPEETALLSNGDLALALKDNLLVFCSADEHTLISSSFAAPVRLPVGHRVL